MGDSEVKGFADLISNDPLGGYRSELPWRNVRVDWKRLREHPVRDIRDLVAAFGTVD